MSEIIAGADGCQAGWVVVRESLPGSGPSWEVVRSLRELFTRPDVPKLLAVDIPIGLPLVGPRACDKEARKLLGRGRSSSVFPAPIRPILAARSYAGASQSRFEAEGKRISKQTWAIVLKIREIDEFLRGEPRYQSSVREVHPEVCFFFMAGRRPMGMPKRSAGGQSERAALLRTHFGDYVDVALSGQRRLGCQPDDVLDALAALWTARRIHAGAAVTVPTSPPRDSFGLRMEMVA